MTEELLHSRRGGRHRIDIVATDLFPLVSLSLVTEPFRVANRESPQPLFHWRVLSPDGAPIRASSGLVLSVEGGLTREPADVVILLASYHPERAVTARLSAWLRWQAARGAVMGSVETGAMIFAEAGLLTRRPAAAHHEAVAAYREAYGEALFIDRAWDLDGNRCSSAGGIATLDMTLALIARLATPELARRVREVLSFSPAESPGEVRSTARDWAVPRANRDLARAVELMLANLEHPLPVGGIAGRLGMPDWRLRRLFHRHLGTGPAAYYQGLRLEHGRNLLRNSEAPVSQVALLAGFETAESFSRAYRARFGQPPSRDRSW